MNLKQVYQAVLIELEKQKAPSMLLDEFNYYYYKSVIQYINTKYNFCDMNQQEDDDLRVLNMTATLSGGNIVSKDDDKTLFTLPSDYFHLKNCVITFNNPNSKCNSNSVIKKGARRLTSDKYPGILNNYYFKPSYKTPYYYIYNDDSGQVKTGTPVIIKLFYGEDKNINISDISIDYIKYPNELSLTVNDLESEDEILEDLEFPKYVCYEIINIMVKLFLERHRDPRLNTNPIVNQTIAPPISPNK